MPATARLHLPPPAPRAAAAFWDGSRAEVRLGAASLLLEPGPGGWAVLSGGGEPLGDLERLDEAALARSGLRGGELRGLLLAALSAAAAVQVSGAPEGGEPAARHAVARAPEGGSLGPADLDALSARGWRTVSCRWGPGGEILSVLLACP